MSQVWFYSLVSVSVVSLMSFAGALTLVLKSDKFKQHLLYLVSFAAGALLGDVFFHILPEMSEAGFGAWEGFFILLGILVFFSLERFMWWHHSHSEHAEEVHSAVYLTQVGDSLHNFIDGIIIALSFLISPAVGVASTVAIIFHEIPQEMGNFAVLVHGGWKPKKALIYNFLSALAAVAGAVIALLFLQHLKTIPSWVVALAASSFIYVAMTDLIPELQKDSSRKKSLGILFWLAAGMAVMALLLLLE